MASLQRFLVMALILIASPALAELDRSQQSKLGRAERSLDRAERELDRAAESVQEAKASDIGMTQHTVGVIQREADGAKKALDKAADLTAELPADDEAVQEHNQRYEKFKQRHAELMAALTDTQNTLDAEDATLVAGLDSDKQAVEALQSTFAGMSRYLLSIDMPEGLLESYGPALEQSVKLEQTYSGRASSAEARSMQTAVGNMVREREQAESSVEAA